MIFFFPIRFVIDRDGFGVCRHAEMVTGTLSQTKRKTDSSVKCLPGIVHGDVVFFARFPRKTVRRGRKSTEAAHGVVAGLSIAGSESTACVADNRTGTRPPMVPASGSQPGATCHCCATCHPRATCVQKCGTDEKSSTKTIKLRAFSERNRIAGSCRRANRHRLHRHYPYKKSIDILDPINPSVCRATTRFFHPSPPEFLDSVRIAAVKYPVNCTDYTCNYYSSANRIFVFFV